MFTGIVQTLSRVVAIRKTNRDAFSIDVDLADLSRGVKLGDSVAINGVCLTATDKHNSVISFDVIEETLRRTNLQELTAGSVVNVERSLQLSDRIDGHLMLGHVDGVAKILKKEQERDASIKVWFETRKNLVDLMIIKGAIGIDGISLTLVDVMDDKFSVSLIPHTMSVTTLGKKEVGDSVNVEIDFFGKYVKKFIDQLDVREMQSRAKA